MNVKFMRQKIAQVIANDEKILENRSTKITLSLGVIILLAIFAAAIGATIGTDVDPCMRHLCPQYVLSKETLQSWHEQKNANGPTFAGTPSWKLYLSQIEMEGLRRGMVDFRRNEFTYNRWYTTDWPDKTSWSLTVGRQEIDVGGYAANSGMTGAEGITAELVLLSQSKPEDLKGKIVIMEINAGPLERYVPDWLYQPPENKFPIHHEIKPEETIYQSTVSQLFSANLEGKLGLPGPHHLKMIKESGAAGFIIIFDMANERVDGLFSYPTPAIYNVPTLYLGRESGDMLKVLMKEESRATLKLDAKVEETKAYQLAGFLPGKNYGRDNDQIILMISHTDGPSLSQENGPFGLLGIVHYFNQFEVSLRDKTLMFFLDSRHYVPNREASLPDFDIEKVLVPGGALAPEHGKIVASVHLEHLGQIEFHEVEGQYKATGGMEMGAYYVTGYQPIIDIARAALLDHRPQNQFLRSTDLPGVHCERQGIWFGLGHWPQRIGIEAIASNISYMGAYWSTAADLDYLNIDQFIMQMNVMTQITGNFMQGNVKEMVAEKASQAHCQNEKSP